MVLKPMTQPKTVNELRHESALRYQSGRYAWAENVDPKAVKEYNRSVEERRVRYGGGGLTKWVS